MNAAGLLLLAVLEAASPQDVARPSAEDGPTRVEIGIYLVDLWQIDGARQNYSADFVVNARWTDARHRHEGPGVRSLDLARIWQPRLQILNARALRSAGPLRLEVDPDGRVTHTERYSGELSALLDLADFPFDRQRLAIQVVSPYTSRDVLLSVLQDRTGQTGKPSVSDWSLGTAQVRVEEQLHPASGERLQGLLFAFEATRHYGYYLWKVYLPLLFILLMSWTVFWMNPGKLSSSQVSISVTSMLTLTAYRFSLGNEVPRVSYLTKFDLLFTAATAFVFLALVEVIWSISLESRGKEAPARMLDLCARWGFPAGFLVCIAVIHLT